MMSNNTEYEKRSYEDLSLEFQRLYPSVIRAFELIPLMYNRLTLVDKLSHKQAFDKICDDHKHLSGFSEPVKMFIRTCIVIQYYYSKNWNV